MDSNWPLLPQCVMKSFVFGWARRSVCGSHLAIKTFAGTSRRFGFSNRQMNRYSGSWENAASNFSAMWFGKVDMSDPKDTRIVPTSEASAKSSNRFRDVIQISRPRGQTSGGDHVRHVEVGGSQEWRHQSRWRAAIWKWGHPWKRNPP